MRTLSESFNRQATGRPRLRESSDTGERMWRSERFGDSEARDARQGGPTPNSYPVNCFAYTAKRDNAVVKTQNSAIRLPTCR
jgi:hypothetical protein